ncbi:MAG: sugar ABC transporter permease [Schumannella sp.]
MKADRRWTPYLLVAPAFLLFAFVVLIPAVLNTALSVMDWSGTNQMTFVGLDNFFRAFRDDIYLMAYRNTFVYIGLTLILEVLAGLILAGLVTMRGRRTAFYRIAFFVPVMLPMVVIAVLWAFVYSDDIGLINSGLRAIGLDEWAPVWLGDPSTALIAVSVVSGWIYAGFYMAIFYAALQRIPTHIVEAATLDGASQWRIFFSIRVPMIRPIIEIAVLLCVTGAFQRLRPVLRHDQRRSGPRDRDHHDLSGRGRLPLPQPGLRRRARNHHDRRGARPRLRLHPDPGPRGGSRP